MAASANVQLHSSLDFLAFDCNCSLSPASTLSPASPRLVTPEPSLLCALMPRCASGVSIIGCQSPSRHGTGDVGAAACHKPLSALAPSAGTAGPSLACGAATIGGTQPHRRSPLGLRQQHSSCHMRSASSFLTSAGPISFDSEDDGDGSVGPLSYGTPHQQLPAGSGPAHPAFTNPLFDSVHEYPSPLTQPLSAGGPSGSAFRSTASATGSPTYHTHSSHQRHEDRRRDLHRRYQRHQHQNPNHTAGAAAAVAATLPLLRGLGGRTRHDQGALVSSLAVLLGVGDDFEGNGRRGGGGTDPDGTGYSSDSGDGNGGEEDAGDGSGGEEARFGITLELLRHAAALQQQLVSRAKEASALRLQLEESYSAREEMGLQLLSCQEYVTDLERRLEHEARGRAGLLAQSQLLQQQLQEADEAWRDAQVLARVQSQSQPSQQHQQQGEGSATGSTSTAQPPCGSGGASSLSRPAAQPWRPSVDATRDGVGAGGGASVEEVEDPRDATLEALRRENESLTSRLIACSLAAAEAREREEQARHEAHLLHDLNAEVMQSVNTLSLELSLLRPKACGRAGGRFHLPFMGSGSGNEGGGR